MCSSCSSSRGLDPDFGTLPILKIVEIWGVESSRQRESSKSFDDNLGFLRNFSSNFAIFDFIDELK